MTCCRLPPRLLRSGPKNLPQAALPRRPIERPTIMETKKLKFAMITVGTRGDVQPLTTLTKALLRRGHAVVLCTNETFRSFVSDELSSFAAGWTFVGLQGDPMAIVREGVHAAIFKLTEPVYAANADIMLKAFPPDALPDVVIGNLAVWTLACVLAEGWNRPMVFLPFVPPVAHAADDAAPCVFSPTPFPFAWMNVAAARVLPYLATMTTFNPQDIRNLQARLHLPRKPLMEIFMALLRFPYVLAYSPTLCPMPVRWVRDGHWFYECGSLAPIHANPDAPLPAALEAFLSRGTGDVVYFGWGSMCHFGNPVDVTRMVLQCVDLLVQQSGGGGARRAIVQSGWVGLRLSDLQSSGVPGDRELVERLAPVVFELSEPVDHVLLFPRVAAVVHHGGSGTTHTALAAGVPQVITPTGVLDQPYWAARVATLGLGPRKTVSVQRLTAGVLADLVAEALAPAVARRAEEVGLQVRTREGDAGAVCAAALEDVAARDGRGGGGGQFWRDVHAWEAAEKARREQRAWWWRFGGLVGVAVVAGILMKERQ